MPYSDYLYFFLHKALFQVASDTKYAFGGGVTFDSTAGNVMKLAVQAVPRYDQSTFVAGWNS